MTTPTVLILADDVTGMSDCAARCRQAGLPAAIWLFRSDEVAWGVFLVAWSVILVSNIDNVIKPLFISRGSALPLLLVLIGMLGGAMAFGLVGVFLGPTVLAILYTLMREWSPGEYVLRATAGPRRAPAP